MTSSKDGRNDDRDELQDSDQDLKDPDFSVVQSDILRPKRQKKLRFSRTRSRLSGRMGGYTRGENSDIEFETRRSSRANKNTKNMTDNQYEDEEIFYIEDEKSVGVSKTASMRETFQQSYPVDFKKAHHWNCTSCGYGGSNPNKGALIPCQGCSSAQHKACLGARSTRDQCVTKVSSDSCVLQCRFCVCVHRKKDPRAPREDTCQVCHVQGRSCARFSEKKTPKQEEKIRAENDGVDPVTPIDPKLVNNGDTVLFRCEKCHRGWHYEHLPHPIKTRDPAIDDPLNLRRHRLEEYQINWLCKECLDTEELKPDKLVAWRPISRASYTRGQSIEDFTEDQVEYLVRWEKKSYNHCVWMPGSWVYGIVKAGMRKSFVNRTFGENADNDEFDDEFDDDTAKDQLLRWTTRDAIHDTWITPDIILAVNWAPRSREAERAYKLMSRKEKFEDDKSRIFHVIQILVKFEGLSYDDVVWDDPPSPNSGALWDAFLEAYHEFLNGKHFKSVPWRTMQERIDTFRETEFSEIEVKEQPKGLQRGKLMAYQLEGLNWMLYNFRHERSVILADEMGLGKTVQVVALLSSFIQDNPKIWPFLIVVPNATCANWRREIKKWAPDLRVVAYYGGRVAQNLAYQYELFPQGSKEMKAHVLIMSYDSIKDSETRHKFSAVKWAGMVVDEAQALKNDENGLYRALSALRVPFKLLLTGTPLQNNKRELFNLLQFIDPKMNANKLDEQFGEITEENLPRLHELIRPYFLRRTKAMVLTFLPTMAQIIIPVTMSVVQEKLCKSIMERNPELIRSVFARGKLKTTERGSLSNILMQLRKCLCHPFVYSQAIEDRSAPPDLMRRNLIEASSKLVLLEIMLPKLKERGHRVLIFSQFLEQLTILEDFLASLDMRYERLDGSQSSMEKQKRIDAFNAPDSRVFAMLLSTRAGGVGINLATADTVIILDPDWNPHQDIQALSRAHRIGQRKKVLCFQLMTVDSAEEKILQIGRKKMALDHLLIESMDEREGEFTNDVESVLKHGAAALFGEGEKKSVITYDAASVDKLLDRSVQEETKQDGDKSAESAFAFARIWAQDKDGDLSEDLQTEERTITQGVWDEILQKRAEEARLEAERNMETLGRGGRRRGAANYTSEKFDFEEPQDVAGIESDQASVDGSFVGESDAESSADEAQMDGIGPSGESEVNGSNLRKSQGKGSQGTSTNKTPTNKTPTKASTRKTGSLVTPKPALKKNPSRANSSLEGQNPKSRTPIKALFAKTRKVDPDDSPYQPPNPRASRTSKTPTPNKAKSQPGSGSGSSSTTQGAVNGSPRAGQPNPVGRQPNGTSFPGQHEPNGIRQQPGQPEQPGNVNVRQGDGDKPGEPSGAVPGAGISIRTREDAVSLITRAPKDPCLVCDFLHPLGWECPEMQHEVSLRLALDKLRLVHSEDLQKLVQQRAFILSKLAQLQNRPR
ncbi:PHD/FYVE-zinc-finger like domain-containing protein [Lasiosphaeris hirsuta]|uniref:PHD/FYVE-zinc-finger like domain-containing protein n=1 Tax=Lasiosphaeris hirsuta TaxID=260670 RepID=A0AA40ARE0_9PEZI|nr:PHD/FYVE-zinc-finger like domain-containing protein [Lasiosphaeris hirsuta]